MAPINLFETFAKLTLDTSDYEKNVDDATDQSKKLTGALEDTSKSSDTAGNKIKVLAAQYNAAQEKVDQLTSAFNESIQKNGAASEETQRLAKELEEAESEASGLKDALKSAATGAEDASDGFTVMKGAMADLVSNGIQTVISGFGNLLSTIWNLDEATAEYSIAQGRLTTAYEASGLGAEAADTAFRNFYAIIGDTDTATEASQLLAKLAQSEEDVAKWTEIAAGVSGTFGDSLPIESLIEATNETAKVGTVTGTLADALNWAGLSEDEFNAKLAECTDESERNRLIMETLSSTYQDATDAFYETNDALVRSREAQVRMQDSLVLIGDAISNVKTAFMEELAPAVEAIAPQIADFISSFDVESVAQAMGDFIDMIIDNGPTIISVISGIAGALVGWNVATTIQGLVSSIQAFKLANEGATVAQWAMNAAMNANPVGIVVSLIAGLVTAITTLWMTNENFRNAVTEIWTNITTFLSTAIASIGQWFIDLYTSLTTTWNSILTTATMIWTNITNFITTTVTNLVTTVTTWWTNLTTSIANLTNQIFATLQSIWTSITSFLSETVQNIWNTIQTAWTNITTSISEALQNIWNTIVNAWTSILDWLSQLPTRLWTLGRDMFTRMREGISAVIGTVYTTVRNGIQQAIDWITSLPAQAVNWGRDMIQGFINGIASMIRTVIDTVANLASQVASYLHFSRPDVGPLHDYETWMPDFMRGLAKGISDNAYMVEDAVKGLSTNMVVTPDVEEISGSASASRGAAAPAGYGAITINVYGAEGQSVNALADAVAIRLQQMTRRREKVRA